jgi:RNA polymerase sigma factor (sigma-70 family)
VVVGDQDTLSAHRATKPHLVGRRRATTFARSGATTPFFGAGERLNSANQTDQSGNAGASEPLARRTARVEHGSEGREKTLQGVVRALSKLERDLVAADGLDLAVDRPDCSLPELSRADVALVDRRAILPQRQRDQRSLVVLDEDVPALVAVELRELTAGVAEAVEGLVDSVGLDRVPGDTCVHAGTLTPSPVYKRQVVSRPLPESDLVERARAGDAQAYEALVREHQGIAFRTAYLLTGSAADAEESAQDGFVKAYRALGRFRRGAPFRPWVLEIVANEARNRRRSAGRRTALAVGAAAEAPSGEAAPSPEGVLLASEERGDLLAAVNALREDDRLVLACRYFLELSEEETAAALGIRRGTVKSRLSRALERLRAELGVTA